MVASSSSADRARRDRRAPARAETQRGGPETGGACPLFRELLDTGLTDVGRAMDPANTGLFTWWAPWRNLRARNIGWRLDYMLASGGLFAQAQRCVVQSKVGTSDHAPVVMEVTS